MDDEEIFRVMQALQQQQDQEKAKTAEEVDLDYIDLFEPDPDHYTQAHTNKLSPQWTIEEGIEIQDLFDRGCLHQLKRADLPKGSRIVGSRFQYKIKCHHVGDNRLKVNRLKSRLVVQGQHMSRPHARFHTG